MFRKSSKVVAIISNCGRMKCMRCNSIRVMKFVDGFGEKRVFCRDCWWSFPENLLVKFNSQKNLNHFRVDSYYKFIERR